MRRHLADGTRPQEVNPPYLPDVINDRWPRAGAAGVADMKILAEALVRVTTSSRLHFRSIVVFTTRYLSSLVREFKP